jgi:predicted metal-dependent hydrolase
MNDGMTRSYSDGEIFMYRGAPLRLLALLEDCGDGGGCGVSVSDDSASLVVRAASPDARRRLLLFWYTSETERIVQKLVPLWSKRLSVRPRLAAVKHARTRWGSCSRSGALFFNSRLAMLSCDVAEYVVVHELCHLKHMNHSRAFWEAVELALPGSLDLRGKLRREERDAHI